MTPFDVSVAYYKLPGQRDQISYLIPSFVHFLKKVYIEQVLDALDSPRRKLRGQKQLVGWASFCKDVGVSEDPRAVLTEGLLKASFLVKRYPSGYVLTLDNRARIGKNFPLVKYLRLLEYGSSTFPSRKVLLPIKRGLESNLKYYWDLFYDSLGADERDGRRNLRSRSVRVPASSYRKGRVRTDWYRSKPNR